MVDTAEANMVFLCFFHQLWDQHESVRPDLLNITVPHFWEKKDGKKHGKTHESGWSPYVTMVQGGNTRTLSANVRVLWNWRFGPRNSGAR